MHRLQSHPELRQAEHRPVIVADVLRSVQQCISETCLHSELVTRSYTARSDEHSYLQPRDGIFDATSSHPCEMRVTSGPSFFPRNSKIDCSSSRCSIAMPRASIRRRHVAVVLASPPGPAGRRLQQRRLDGWQPMGLLRWRMPPLSPVRRVPHRLVAASPTRSAGCCSGCRTVQERTMRSQSQEHAGSGLLPLHASERRALRHRRCGYAD
jgi:hypothetical protein